MVCLVFFGVLKKQNAIRKRSDIGEYNGGKNYEGRGLQEKDEGVCFWGIEDVVNEFMKCDMCPDYHCIRLHKSRCV